MKDPRFAKSVVLINGMVPLGMLAWDAYRRQLGPDPSNDAIHITGVMAIIFIALTLAVTPVRKITGWNWLSHFRRMLGLFAFFYAFVHLLLYFALQRSFDVTRVIEDTEKRPFIFFGMAALVLMIPLAITSTNGMIKGAGCEEMEAAASVGLCCRDRRSDSLLDERKSRRFRPENLRRRCGGAAGEQNRALAIGPNAKASGSGRNVRIQLHFHWRR